MGTGIGDWHRTPRRRARNGYDRQTRRRVGAGDRVARAEGGCVKHLRTFGRVLPEPTAEHRKPIRGAARTMVGASKVIPLEFLHATGILAGARGYPRCPDTAISTAGILAEIGGAWGPPCFVPRVQQRIDGLRAWATVPGDGDPEWPEWARGDQQYEDRIGGFLGPEVDRRDLREAGARTMRGDDLCCPLLGRPRWQRRRPRNGRNDDLQV